MSAKATGPSLTCPDCGHTITLTEAIAQQIAGPVLARKAEDLRRQIGEEVSAAHAAALQDLRAALAEKDETLKERDDALEKLRAGEVRLRRDRRKLEDEKKDLEGQHERMRDEIHQQERSEAQRAADQRMTDPF
jgi:DNA repair exonuclease SbcCD ATPase subunit